MTLSKKECVPCKGGVPPLSGDELEQLEEQVDGWDVIEEHHISKFCKGACICKQGGRYCRRAGAPS